MTIAQLNRYMTSVGTQSVTIRETVLVSDNDVLNLNGRTLELYADPAIIIDGAHWTIKCGKLRAMVGVLFECIGSSSGLILNVWAAGLLRGKELFRCIGTNQCYDTHVIGGEWERPQGMIVPTVNVAVSGPFYNANRWTSLRFQTNGMPAAPVFKLVCTHDANWLYGNTIEYINFEIPNAGAIHLESCFGTSLRQIEVFDADLFGPITDDLIKVTKRSTGLRSRNTSLRGYFRLSGTRNANVVDINIPSTVHYQPALEIGNVDGIDGALVAVIVPAWLETATINAQITTG